MQIGSIDPRARARGRVVVATLAILLSLLCAEGVARVVASFEPDARVGIYRASGIPGVGYTLIPKLDTHALGIRLRTNALGFRGPEWSTRKAPGTIRIALMGDSHAFGFGVDFAHTLGEVLARELSSATGRPSEVLNFAVNGYNSRQELAVLQSFALAYAPDVVVFVPSNNDDEPSSFASRAGYLIARPEDADLPPPPPRPTPPSALVALARGALDRARRTLARDGTAHAAPPGRAAQSVEQAPVPASLLTSVAEPLHEMIRMSRTAGAQVVLAPFAGPPDWRHMLQDIAREDDVPLVELLQLLPEAHDWQEILDRFGLGWDPHLGPVAHGRWGETLAKVVRERLVLPAS